MTNDDPEAYSVEESKLQVIKDAKLIIVLVLPVVEEYVIGR